VSGTGHPFYSIPNGHFREAMCCRDAAFQTLSGIFRFEPFDGVIRRKRTVGQQFELGPFNELKLGPVPANIDQDRSTSPCFKEALIYSHVRDRGDSGRGQDGEDAV
jgi:hypothetical protein